MGLFKILANYLNKPSPAEELQLAFQKALKDADIEDEKNKTDIDLECEFEDRYEKTLERMDDQITNILPQNDDPADQKVSAYQKAIARFDKIKEFCDSKGKGGSLYYANHFAEDKESIISEYNEFMNEEYQEMKDQEQEDAEYFQYCRDTKKQILKLASAADGYLQKDIYKQFPSEDKNLVIKMINDLCKEGKLSKSKQGNTNLLFKLKQKAD